MAVWALQFTPRVTILEDAVLMEVEASVRLFGGKRALRDRVVAQGKARGVTQVAWAGTGLGALALARSGIENGFKKPLQQLLDRLGLDCLSAVRRHAVTLAQAGCRTLGDVRRLPRGGLSRRFDKDLLHALDTAYGQGHADESYPWEALPDTFKARRELPARVEHAPALLHAAEPLLVQMCDWLCARHTGATSFTLAWRHDFFAPRDAGTSGQIAVGTAKPSRDVVHLAKLLGLHLDNTTLQAPAGELELTADDVHDQGGQNASLFQNPEEDGESLDVVLERMAVRLGAQAVKRPVACEDHRQEKMAVWQPVGTPLPRKTAPTTELPQPTWVLREPIRLAVRKDRPFYQGELQLLAGPQCVEGGWWDRDEAAGRGRNVVRDYWLAESEHAGLLWIFKAKLDDGIGWYLHGVFG